MASYKETMEAPPAGPPKLPSKPAIVRHVNPPLATYKGEHTSALSARCGTALICGVGSGLASTKPGDIVPIQDFDTVSQASIGELHGALACVGARKGLYIWTLLTTDNMARPNLETMVLEGETIRSVSCGGQLGVAATSNGDAYMWGVGLPELSRIPFKVCSKVLEVSCGKRHVLAKTFDHRLVSWGANTHGQLGRDFNYGSKKPDWVDKPNYVSGPAVSSFCAGGRHSLAVTEAGGELLTWGSNTLGQCGLGDSCGEALAPQVVTPSWRGTAQLVSAGQFHSIMSTTLGEVYSCGLNKDGQCGLGHTDVVTRFRKIDSPAQLTFPVKISCGASHSIAITADFNVYTWGAGSKGQLGPLGGKDAMTRPRQMLQLGQKGDVINDVACGENTSIFITYNEAKTLENLMKDLLPTYDRPVDPITVAACAWNVNSISPGPGALQWIKQKEADASIYIIGLQEVDLSKNGLLLDAVSQADRGLKGAIKGFKSGLDFSEKAAKMGKGWKVY